MKSFTGPCLVSFIALILSSLPFSPAQAESDKVVVSWWEYTGEGYLPICHDLRVYVGDEAESYRISHSVKRHPTPYVPYQPVSLISERLLVFLPPLTIQGSEKSPAELLSFLNSTLDVCMHPTMHRGEDLEKEVYEDNPFQTLHPLFSSIFIHNRNNLPDQKSNDAITKIGLYALTGMSPHGLPTELTEQIERGQKSAMASTHPNATFVSIKQITDILIGDKETALTYARLKNRIYTTDAITSLSDSEARAISYEDGFSRSLIWHAITSQKYDTAIALHEYGDKLKENDASHLIQFAANNKDARAFETLTMIGVDLFDSLGAQYRLLETILSNKDYASMSIVMTHGASPCRYSDKHPRPVIANAINGHDMKAIGILAKGCSSEQITDVASKHLRVISGNHPELIDTLLDAGLSPAATISGDRTLLMQSLWAKSNELTHRLIQLGAIEMHSSTLRCGLFGAAIRFKRNDITDEIVHIGLEPTVDCANSAIAQTLDIMRTVNLLVDMGVPIANSKALILAVQRKDKESVRQLIAMGHNLDVQDQDGITALMMASDYRFSERIDTHIAQTQALMRERSARGIITTPDRPSPQIIDDTGTDYPIGASRYSIALIQPHGPIADRYRTPINIEQLKRDSILDPWYAATLLDAGAKFDLRDNVGRTALLRSASSGNQEVAKLLIDYGASINAADSQGRTAKDLAVRFNNAHLLNLFGD